MSDEQSAQPEMLYNIILRYNGNKVEFKAFANGQDIMAGHFGPPALVLEGLAAELDRALDAAIQNKRCVWVREDHPALRRPTPVPSGPKDGS